MKELIEKLQETFLNFQKSYDEQLKKVKEGLSTAATSDKVEALNAEITRLQGDIEEAKKAHNQAALQIAALEIGGSGSGKKVDRETLALHATQFYARKNGNDNQRVEQQDIEAYSKYCTAFASWVKRGDHALNDPDIRNAMQVGSDPNGGYWVPTEKLSEVLTKLHETSPMRELADVMTITGDSIEIMTDMDLAESGGWVGETETRNDTDNPGLGMMTMYVREQYAQPKTTQKLLDMSTVNAEAWLMGKIEEILSLTENTGYVSGNGVKSPRGFLDYASSAVTTADKTRAWGVLQYVATGEDAGFPVNSGMSGHDANFIIDLTTALRAPFRAGAVWVMNRLTEAEFRKLKDNEGRYLVTGGIEGAFTGFQLGGFPIRHFEDMPLIGSGSYSAAFGNFRQGYQILDGRGLRVLRDPYTQKPYVKFYTTKWTGGDVKRFDAIKLLKFSAS